MAKTKQSSAVLNAPPHTSAMLGLGPTIEKVAADRRRRLSEIRTGVRASGVEPDAALVTVEAVTPPVPPPVKVARTPLKPAKAEKSKQVTKPKKITTPRLPKGQRKK